MRNLNKLPINYLSASDDVVVNIGELNSFAKYIKITKANLILHISSTGNNSIRFDYGNPSIWENVEQINFNSGNETSYDIDVTDELQDSLDKDLSSFILHLNYLTEKTNEQYVVVSTASSVMEIDYISKDEFKKNGQYESFDLGNAGSAKIDLSIGTLNINKNLANFNDNGLSTDISLNYSNLSGTEQRKVIINGSEITLPDVKCGNGNYLNLNQYIIKSKNNNLNDFMYIDENGKQHILDKRYYYNNNYTKSYVAEENLNIGVDGSVYAIINNQRYDNLTCEYQDELGFQLIEDISNYQNFKQFAESDEYIKLIAEKDSIDHYISNLNNNLITYKEQLINTLIAKKYFESRFSNKEFALSIKALDWQSVDISTLTGLFTPSELELIDDFNLINDMRALTDSIDAICNAGEDNQSYTPITKVLFETKDIGSYTAQIKSLTDTINHIKYELEEYNARKLTIESRILQLKLIRPVYYLIAGQKVYGFAESFDYSLAEFEQINYRIYRLVLISDSYENYININYDSLGSSLIKTVTNSQNQTLSFEYKNDRLTKLSNDAEQILLTYNNSNLSFMNIGNTNQAENEMFPNNQYEHNESYVNIYDSSNKLVAAVSANGLGYKFYYLNNKIIKVQKLSLFDKIVNNKVLLKTKLNLLNVSDANALNFIDTYLLDEKVEFAYYDYKSTFVTYNSKKTYTYLFDKYGNITTKYLNNLDVVTGEFSADVESYEYNNGNISNSATINKSAHNFLTQTFPGTPTVQESEYYLGDNIYCGDNVYLTSFEQYSAIHEVSGSACIELTQSEIDDLLASNHKYFVISGWAKANSASIESHNDSRYGRKFQYKVNIKGIREYTDSQGVVINESFESTESRDFDWMNTQWQYCSVGFSLRKIKSISSIKIYFEYVNNTGTALITNPKLQIGKYTEQQYIENLLRVLVNFEDRYKLTRYYYNDDKLLIAKATGFIDINNINHLVKNIYDYNDKNSLIKETIINTRYDSASDEYFVDSKKVIEYKYNDKGTLISTKFYNDADPTSCYYSENQYDEKGNETTTINELGREVDSSSVVDGYGSSDKLLHASSAVTDGLDNRNMFVYDRDVLTEIEHNDFSIKYDYDNKLRPTSIKIENETYCEYSYDDNSTEITLQNNDTITIDYDDDGNILNKKYNNSTIKSNIYNSNGDILCSNDYVNVTASNDPTVKNSEKTTYEYDENGKLTNKVIEAQVNNQTTEKLRINNNYNDNGQVSTTTLSFGNENQSYSYTYKDNSLEDVINSVSISSSNSNVLTQNISYDLLDRPKQVDTIVGQKKFTKRYSYLKNGDHTSNLISAEWFGLEGVNRGVIHYTYDANGNITKIKNNGDFVVGYEYDKLSRIVRENNKKENFTKTFEYDAGGNILEVRKYYFTISSLDDESPIEVKRYLYRTEGWRDQLMGYTVKTIDYGTSQETFDDYTIGGYDQLGNPTTYKGNSMVWTRGRCLTSYNGNNFEYNADGIRTKKNNTTYVLNGTEILSQTDGTDTLVFRYGVNGLVGFKLNGTEYVYQKNIFGDIIGIFDTNQNLITKYTYDAWGNCQISVDNTQQSAYNIAVKNPIPLSWILL